MAPSIPVPSSTLIHLLPCLLLTLMCSCSRGGTTTVHEIEVGAFNRKYTLFVPAAVKANKAAPVVFVFHGSGGTGPGFDRMSGFRDVAELEEFVLVMPNAIEHNWNDGRAIPGIASMDEDVDDVAFVDAMIEDIGRTQRLDSKRLYATGFSNGGIFVHLLAAKSRHRFAAIAPVSGGIAEPIEKAFQPSAPVSVLILHGTNDPMVPFDGGEVDYHDNGRIIGTEEAARRWVQCDHLTAQPTSGVLPDTDKNDGCTVSWKRWTGQKRGAEVVLFTIHGGGHTWASGPQFLPVALIGHVCRDIDATDVIWDFFKKHPLP